MVLERRLETMLESFNVSPPVAAMQVTVDPPPIGSGAGASSPPVDPLAQTIAATHAKDRPAVPIVPPAAIGMAGNAPPAPSLGAAPEPPPRTSGRFVPVRPGELDSAPPERPAGTWISPQTWALAVGLLAVWLLAWYMLQPPSADQLYGRIQRQTKDDSAESLQQAEDDIRQFLALFPHDPRSVELKDYVQRIDMSRLERRLELQAKGVNLQTSLSPVERCYLEALNTARLDREAGILKLRAMIDLYQSPRDVSGPNWRCIELAKRRLSEFSQQDDARSKEELGLVGERISRADELRKTDPQRAEAIYQAVIVLYQNKAWAKDLVQRARSALEKGK
jgi:serine/threonine-protein kinase